MHHYSEKDILDGIYNGDKDVLRYVYGEYYPTIQVLIFRNSGKDEDAEDIFQDTLMIIYQKVKNNDLKLECSFKTYFYSISRNLWLQKLDKNKISGNPYTDIENFIELSDEFMYEIFDEENEKIKLLQKHFLNLSKDCIKVLRLFLTKMPLKEIQEIMGFKTLKYTKTRKFLCKENLKKRIFNDPRYKKYLSDE